MELKSHGESPPGSDAKSVGTARHTPSPEATSIPVVIPALLRSPARSLPGHRALLPWARAVPQHPPGQSAECGAAAPRAPPRARHSPARRSSRARRPRRRRAETRIARSSGGPASSPRRRKVSGGLRAGPSRKAQRAPRAPAAGLSLGPPAPAPRRGGGGIPNKVPAPRPGGGRSLVTRCPRHTPAARAAAGGGARRAGWGTPSFAPRAPCQFNPQRGGGAGPARLCHGKLFP